MTPIPIRRMLVAVDFGEASRQALIAGGLIARRTAAALQVLHAESPEAPAYFTHEQVAALAAQRARMESQARAFLETFARQHAAAPFTTALESLPPADAILHHLADADLIVMGTHGRHGPRRWWLGSVAERVLQLIDRPLLIVHAADRPATMFERIGVFATPARSGARAFEFATALAASLGGPLNDSRREAIDVAAMHHHASLVVVSMPCPHDRRWLSEIGEPLVRAAAGPVLFVPDREVSGGSS